ncbi:hypothetical protein N9980_00730 [bacterium]|nr:hypothetical protein [bacterium]
MKTTFSRIVVVIVAVAGVAVTLTGCSTATPTDTPGVDRMGQYVLKQFGPELWTLLGYRFANSQLGDEWMILEIGLSSPNGQSAKVAREDIFLLSPSGNRIPLATQRQFNEAWGSLRSTIEKANVNRDPLEYFPPSRIECAIQFFVTPGQGVSFDEVTLNDRRGCFGRLFIDVPGGIQAGRWILGIDLEESEIRIPFDLGE